MTLTDLLALLPALTQDDIELLNEALINERIARDRARRAKLAAVKAQMAVPA